MSKSFKTPHYSINSYSQTNYEPNVNILKVKPQTDMMISKLLNKSKNKGVFTIGEHANKDVILDTDSDAPGKTSKGVAKLICFSTTQNVYRSKPIYQTREKLSSYLIKTQPKVRKPISNEQTSDLRTKNIKKDYNIVFPGKDNSKNKFIKSPQSALETNESRSRLHEVSTNARGYRHGHYSSQHSPQIIMNTHPSNEPNSFYSSNKKHEDNLENEQDHIDNKKLESVLSELSNKRTAILNCKRILNPKSRNILLTPYRIDFDKIENEKESDENFENTYLTGLLNSNSNGNNKLDQGGKVSLLLYWNFYEYIKKYQLSNVVLIQRCWRRIYAQKTMTIRKVILIQSFWRRYRLRANLYFMINRYYRGRPFIIHIFQFYSLYIKRCQREFLKLLLIRDNKSFDTNSTMTIMSKSNRDKEGPFPVLKKQKIEEDIDSLIKNSYSPSSLQPKPLTSKNQVFSITKSQFCLNIKDKEKEYEQLYFRLLNEYNELKESKRHFEVIELDACNPQLDLIGFKNNDYYLKQLEEHKEIAFTYEKIKRDLMLDITKSNRIAIPKSLPSKFSIERIDIDSLTNDLTIKANKFIMNASSFKMLPCNYGISSYDVYINSNINKNDETGTQIKLRTNKKKKLQSPIDNDNEEEDNKGGDIDEDKLRSSILKGRNKHDIIPKPLSDYYSIEKQKDINYKSIITIPGKNKKKSLSAFPSLELYHNKPSENNIDKPQSSEKKISSLFLLTKRHSVPHNEISTLSKEAQNIKKTKSTKKHRLSCTLFPSALFNFPYKRLSNDNIKPPEHDSDSYKNTEKESISNKFKQYLMEKESDASTFNVRHSLPMETIKDTLIWNIINKRWTTDLIMDKESFYINDTCSFNAENNFHYLTNKLSELPLKDSVFTRYLRPKQQLKMKQQLQQLQHQQKSKFALANAMPLMVNSFYFELEGAYDPDEFAHNILLVNAFKRMNSLSPESQVFQIEYISDHEERKDSYQRSSIRQCLLPYKLKKHIIGNSKREVYYTLIEKMMKIYKNRAYPEKLSRAMSPRIRNDNNSLRDYYNAWKLSMIKSMIYAEIELNQMRMIKMYIPRLVEEFSIVNIRETVLYEEKGSEVDYKGKTRAFDYSHINKKQFEIIAISNRHNRALMKDTNRITEVEQHEYIGTAGIKPWVSVITCNTVNSIACINQKAIEQTHALNALFTHLNQSDTYSISIPAKKSFNQLNQFIIPSSSFSVIGADKGLYADPPITMTFNSKDPELNVFKSLTPKQEKTFAFIACKPNKIILRDIKRSRHKKFYTNTNNRSSIECEPMIKRKSTKRIKKKNTDQYVKSWNRSLVYKQTKFKFISQISKRLPQLELYKAFIKWRNDSNSQSIEMNSNCFKTSLALSNNEELQHSSREQGTPNEIMNTEPNDRDERMPIMVFSENDNNNPICDFSSRKASNPNSNDNANDSDIPLSMSNLRIKKIGNRTKGYKSNKANSSFLPSQQKKMRTVTRYLTSSIITSTSKSKFNQSSNLGNEYQERNSSSILNWNSNSNINNPNINLNNSGMIRHYASSTQNNPINKSEYLNIPTTDIKSMNHNQFLFVFNTLILKNNIKSAFKQLKLNTIGAVSIRRTQSKMYDLINKSNQWIEQFKKYFNHWRETTRKSRIRTKRVNRLVYLYAKAHYTQCLIDWFNQWRLIKNVLRQQQPSVIKIKIKHATIYRHSRYSKLRFALSRKMTIKTNTIKHYFDKWAMNSFNKLSKANKAFLLIANAVTRNQLKHTFKMLLTV